MLMYFCCYISSCNVIIASVLTQFVWCNKSLDWLGFIRCDHLYNTVDFSVSYPYFLFFNNDLYSHPDVFSRVLWMKLFLTAKIFHYSEWFYITSYKELDLKWVNCYLATTASTNSDASINQIDQEQECCHVVKL